MRSSLVVLVVPGSSPGEGPGCPGYSSALSPGSLSPQGQVPAPVSLSISYWGHTPPLSGHYARQVLSSLSAVLPAVSPD